MSRRYRIARTVLAGVLAVLGAAFRPASSQEYLSILPKAITEPATRHCLQHIVDWYEVYRRLESEAVSKDVAEVAREQMDNVTRTVWDTTATARTSDFEELLIEVKKKNTENDSDLEDVERRYSEAKAEMARDVARARGIVAGASLTALNLQILKSLEEERQIVESERKSNLHGQLYIECILAVRRR